jgi:prepilin signal peptidase PulO-like enzyme (type II secretory pathway)
MQNNIFLLLSSQMQVFLIGLAGLIMGSFTSLFTYRLATKQPLIFTRSKCTNCQVSLKAINLIPIISWIIQFGKCTKCHAKISIRYPLIEISFLAMFLLVYFILNKEINNKMLLYLAISSMLFAMIIVDLEHYFIPDIMQYLLTIFVGLLVVFNNDNFSLINSLANGFVYVIFGIGLWLFFYYAGGIEAIGIDDLKFFFIAGILLSLQNFIAFMMITGIIGAIFGLAWQKIKKDETFPFAPAMCMSTLICLFFGDLIKISQWIGKIIF